MRMDKFACLLLDCSLSLALSSSLLPKRGHVTGVNMARRLQEGNAVFWENVAANAITNERRLWNSNF